ncbi:ABC transporter substrate-binding protein [Phytoactinopolyspora limicola]|uniref:ABC transporter substrate-binding protein n=1 Tax=Phytoactinopolyspora limicola TaxID=2715536 RepID=UPI0014084BA5|nr:ABC transporter substrate-binding protein [Phytoactinopolyspora limicola]
MTCGVACTALVVAACGSAGGGSGADDPTSEADPEVPAAEAAPGLLSTVDESLAPGGTLDLQVHIDAVGATGLDPQWADLASSWQVMGLVYETLVTVGPDFEVEPMLAESWEQPDDTTYVFHLRSGVEFSNGREMTADDVVGSLERLLELGSVWTGQLGPVESVSATDDATVEVVLAEPYTPFLAALANVPAAILPMREVADGTVDLDTTMLGTGPFVVEDHRPDVSWRFARNEGYWHPDQPALDGIDISIVPQEGSRIAALRDGSASMITLGNVDAPQVLGGVPQVEVLSQASTDYYYLMLNSQAPDSPFADPRVRQAINLAVDRQRIADAALGGLVNPTGVTPVGLPGACEPGDLPSATGDLDAARALLSEAGADDLTFQLSIFSTEPAPAVAQVIEQSLREIGVSVEIEQLEEASWAGKVYGAAPAEFDAALSWFAGYADPGMVTKWWNPDVAGFNLGFMAADDELSSLIDAVNTAPPGPDREQLMADLCAAVEADAQMLPLVTRPIAVGYRADAISPTVYATEGYGNPLRRLAETRSGQQ